jgi:hypothetical protein
MQPFKHGHDTKEPQHYLINSLTYEQLGFFFNYLII